MTAAGISDEGHRAALAAASFGWLLLNEPLGGVLILFGIWIARSRAGERIEVAL